MFLLLVSQETKNISFGASGIFFKSLEKRMSLCVRPLQFLSFFTKFSKSNISKMSKVFIKIFRALKYISFIWHSEVVKTLATLCNTVSQKWHSLSLFNAFRFVGKEELNPQTGNFWNTHIKLIPSIYTFAMFFSA